MIVEKLYISLAHKSMYHRYSRNITICPLSYLKISHFQILLQHIAYGNLSSVASQIKRELSTETILILLNLWASRKKLFERILAPSENRWMYFEVHTQRYNPH